MSRRLVSALVVAALVCVGLLAATGVWLSLRYRPRGIAVPTDRPGVFRIRRGDVGWVPGAHRIVAYLLYAVLAALVVAIMAELLRRRSALWLAPGLLMAGIVATAVAHSTGGELPWSQLALRAVKVNARYEGVWKAAFDPLVRFVLTDRELSQQTYRAKVLLHLVAAPLLLIVTLTGLVWRQRDDRRRPAPEGPPAPPQAR